jgi:hypothetical protein
VVLATSSESINVTAALDMRLVDLGPPRAITRRVARIANNLIGYIEPAENFGAPELELRTTHQQQPLK